MHSVIYSPAARKDLKSLPDDAARRIFRAVQGIKSDPYSHVKKLKGPLKFPIYSLRVGARRMIMLIEDDRMIVKLAAAHPAVELRGMLRAAAFSVLVCRTAPKNVALFNRIILSQNM